MTLRWTYLLVLVGSGCALPSYQFDEGASSSGGSGAQGTGGSGNGGSGGGGSGTGGSGNGGTGGIIAYDGPPSCDPAKNESHDACPGGACCDAPAVEGDTFSRYYSGFQPHTDPQWFATVSDYRLDRLEVTVSRFRVFVDEYALPKVGDGKHPLIDDSGWQAELTPLLPSDRQALVESLDCNAERSFTEQPGAFEIYPVNCVSWAVAFAFCAWDEAWLPTEAEWNYAASGGTEYRRYPWGENPPGNDFSGLAVACTGFDMGNCLTAGTLAPVGTVPNGAGRFLQEDLSGNVAEWTLDYYDEPLPMPCNDCAQLESSESMGGAFFANRSMHGGSFESSQGELRSAERKNSGPSLADKNLGFRCARSL